jgi:hypothetical protein
MALWDQYLQSSSWWAKQTGWSFYGMIRDTGRLMDDTSLNHQATEHQVRLTRGDLLDRLSRLLKETG